jgi:hypothetical protein
VEGFNSISFYVTHRLHFNFSSLSGYYLLTAYSLSICSLASGVVFVSLSGCLQDLNGWREGGFFGGQWNWRQTLCRCLALCGRLPDISGETKLLSRA